MLPPRSGTRRPDENASPAAAYCRDSDWGSPPPYPVREAPNDSRRVLSPSQGTNTLTPPPLPRRDEDAGSPGLRPDWTKMSQAPSSAGKGVTPSSLQGTPLPRRRSAHGLGTPASTQRYRGAEPAADESDYGVATEDWDAFYAGQASTPFVHNASGGALASSQQKAYQLHRSVVEDNVPAEEAASPKPRTLADVRELPPFIEYDDFGMPIERNPAAAVGEATPLAAKRLIGVRPNTHTNTSYAGNASSNAHHQFEGSYAQNSSAAGTTDANRSRRRLATTLQFASPGAVAIDRVLDRIAGADDDMPRPFPDGTPGSTDVDYSPDGNRTAVAHDRSVGHAAIPMEEFSPGRASASASPVRTHRSRARVVAIGGAIGLTVSAATLAGLGIAGLLG